MTCAGLTRECAFASSYERLRCGAVEDGAAGGHVGLVILLREGVAAWMTHASAQATPFAGVAAKGRSFVAPLIPDGLRADVARVLASMVMTATEERYA